mmetsp:Transcript_12986/g.42122  ORF Transcript_12986/g.42122 Transcript_12986/m.42122 type:complete len:246 (-) Transcript_12986:365-1102(-)
MTYSLTSRPLPAARSRFDLRHTRHLTDPVAAAALAASITAQKSASPKLGTAASAAANRPVAEAETGRSDASARFSANRMSFRACLSGNAVGYSRFAIIGPLSATIGEAIAPPSRTACTSSELSPSADASASPSARAASCVPMTRFTTSFIFEAAPTVVPQNTVNLPIAVSSASADRKVSSSPAHMKMRAPLAAGALLPLTGASTKEPPRSCTRSASAAMSSGRSVAQSISAFPSETPSSTPPRIE